MENIQSISYTQDLRSRTQRIFKRIFFVAVFGISLAFSSCTVHRGYDSDGYYEQQGDYGYDRPGDRLENRRWEREHRRWHRLHDRDRYNRYDRSDRYNNDHDADDSGGIIIGR